MKIKKTIQGSIPANKVYNSYNEDKHNVYSTEYTNAQLANIEDKIDTINAKLPKAVACNYQDWQTAQVIENNYQYNTITGFDTTITTNGGNILVSLTVPMQKTGGTCWLVIFVGGTEMMRYGISGDGGIISYTNVFPVKPGTYSVRAAIHNNNVDTVTIYNYTSRAFTVAEV